MVKARTAERAGERTDMTEEEKQHRANVRDAQRRDRFIRLAPKRVNNALKTLANVARMANRSLYEYTDSEADKVNDAVLAAAERVRDAFDVKSNHKQQFTL